MSNYFIILLIISFFNFYAIISKDDFVEKLDLDEVYGFIYRKLWRAADDETKSQYDVLFKLLNGNHTKTVLAIQTGLMQEILKGNNNASR